MKKRICCFVISVSFIICSLLSSCSKIAKSAASSGVDMKLSIAMESGCYEAVKEAINDGADINDTVWSYYTLVDNNDTNPVSISLSIAKEKIACLLIENGADPNYNKGRHSLLTYAVENGQFEAAKALIEHGAEVNYSFSEYGEKKTPLSILIRNSRFDSNSAERVDMASFLLKNGATLSQEEMDEFIYTVGSEAYDLSLIRNIAKALISNNIYSISSPFKEIIIGDFNAALDYLNKVDNLDSFDDEYKSSLIIYASAFGNSDIICRLLDLGCNIQTLGAQAANLVSVAARYNASAVVKLLIDKGVNLNEPLDTTAASAEYSAIFNDNRETTRYVAGISTQSKLPLDYFKSACSVGNSDYIHIRGNLLSGISEDDKENILLSAADGGSADVFKALEEAGITDFTAAFSQASNLSNEAIKFIIDSGTDINSPNSAVNSALFSAIWSGGLDRVKFLVELGASVNPNFGDDADDEPTPLFSAIASGNLEIAEYLLNNGANLDVKNCSGYTPLIYSVDNLSYNMTELLLNHNADKTAKTPDGLTAYDLAQSNYHTVEDQKMIDILS